MKHTPSMKHQVLAAAICSAISLPAVAVTDEEFQALQDQLNQLADQVEQNSTGGSDDTTVGGYGELHYNNWSNDAGDRKKEIDLHRFVIFINHEFNDDIRFFSEFEIEHAIAGEGQVGEVEVEQAYVQFDIDDNTMVNAGVFLLPIGIMNETHEPPTFYGVERNPVEKSIIPATWWEGGAGITGNSDSGLSYDFSIHSGLNVDPLELDIRDGRQKTGEAVANNLAATARIKYTGVAGLTLSASVNYQDDITQDSADNVDDAMLIETHARWNISDVTLTALYAAWDISGAGAEALEKDKQDGGYLEASYRFNPQWGVFVRQNQWDTGGAGDTQKEQTDIGFNYWPHEDVVIKADYMTQNDIAGDYDGFNLGVGYQF